MKRISARWKRQSMLRTVTACLFASILGLSVLPAHAENWGQYTYLGSGVSVSFAQVSYDTYTWKFRNDFSRRIIYMEFRYSYIDADTGILQIDTDVLPVTLGSGEVIGGWTVFTSNSRVPPLITVMKIERE